MDALALYGPSEVTKIEEPFRTAEQTFLLGWGVIGARPACGCLASISPAVAATRVDPIEVLKSE